MSSQNYEVMGSKSLFDAIYPVGSIYTSISDTDPSVLFTGTQWEQITDKFLLGASSISSGSPTYTGGDTGGSTSFSGSVSGTTDGHTLTTSEIPGHTHGLNGHTHGYDEYYATTTGETAISQEQMPSHRHWIGVENGSSKWISNWVQYYPAGQSVWTTGSTGKWLNAMDVNPTGSNQSHSHGGNNAYASRTSGGNSGNTTSTGSGGSHSHSFSSTLTLSNTLPPYLAVYIWKRIA